MNMDTKKALKNASRAGVAASLVALHELGHAELVGWSAVGIAGVAFASVPFLLLEAPLHRVLARWHARNDDCNLELHGSSMEYRIAWEKTNEELHFGWDKE